MTSSPGSRARAIYARLGLVRRSKGACAPRQHKSTPRDPYLRGAGTLPREAWLPSAGALAEVPVIWREWVALVWYRIRYF